MMMSDETVVAPYEDKAKNILKSELKRRGITYAQLAEKLKSLGVQESERNLANKISRGSFTAAFFMMCMDVIGVHSVSLET
jgi:3-mercaptopyruvate sulfurtransferase SseA